MKGTPPPRLGRRAFLRLAALSAPLLGAGGVTVHAWRAAYDLDVVRARRSVERLTEPLRLVLFADAHVGPWITRREVARWVDAALLASPDLVVVLGDLLDRDAPRDVEPVVGELARLRAPLGVHAVWGNHEHAWAAATGQRRLGELDRLRRSLASVGVRVVVDDAVRVRDDVVLVGIDDWRYGRPNLDRAFERADAHDPGHRWVRLLLSHNPDVLPTVDPTRSDLVVSGHTHGGQVVVPGIGPLYTSSAFGTRFLAGWVRGPADGYVSRGLGVSVLPVRLACPPELTVLDLVPLDASQVQPRTAASDGSDHQYHDSPSRRVNVVRPWDT